MRDHYRPGCRGYYYGKLATEGGSVLEVAIHGDGLRRTLLDSVVLSMSYSHITYTINEEYCHRTRPSTEMLFASILRLVFQLHFGRGSWTTPLEQHPTDGQISARGEQPTFQSGGRGDNSLA